MHRVTELASSRENGLIGKIDNFFLSEPGRFHLLSVCNLQLYSLEVEDVLYDLHCFQQDGNLASSTEENAIASRLWHAEEVDFGGQGRY